jgi:DNA-binding GntR family transcriptional regulator
MLRWTMGVALPQIRLSAMRETVAEALRNALMDGKFRPGESLSEVALAAQMGVSRGPVREALLVLAQEGLVVHSQNRGFNVLDLKPEDGSAMAMVRAPLEAMALRMARERATEDDLVSLEANKARIVESFASGDMTATAREDLAFHEAIWQLSGNLWLIQALRRVVIPFFAYTMMFKRRGDTLNANVLEQQHQNYLDFLRGNPEMSADDCVRFHLNLYDERS